MYLVFYLYVVRNILCTCPSPSLMREGNREKPFRNLHRKESIWHGLEGIPNRHYHRLCREIDLMALLPNSWPAGDIWIENVSSPVMKGINHKNIFWYTSWYLSWCWFQYTKYWVIKFWINMHICHQTVKSENTFIFCSFFSSLNQLYTDVWKVQ